MLLFMNHSTLSMRFNHFIFMKVLAFQLTIIKSFLVTRAHIGVDILWNELLDKFGWRLVLRIEFTVLSVGGDLKHDFPLLWHICFHYNFLLFIFNLLSNCLFFKR